MLNVLNQQVLVLSAEISGLMRRTTPEALSAASERWAGDMLALGPWEYTRPDSTQAPGLEEMMCWRGAVKAQTPPVYVVEECSSTLDVAWRLSDGGAFAIWSAVLSAGQWAGRGQLRREWESKPGNVYAAWALPNEGGLRGGPAPMVVGLLLARALDVLGVCVELKWPNDILLHGRKLGGILLEQRGRRLLAGVGINLAHAPDGVELRTDAAMPAVALADMCTSTLPQYGPLRLWAAVADVGRSLWEREFAHWDAKQLAAAMNERLAWRGRDVRVVDSGGALDGRVGELQGVTEEGALELRFEEGMATLDSGSIKPVIPGGNAPILLPAPKGE